MPSVVRRTAVYIGMLCTISCDQVSKQWAVENLAGRPPRSVVGDKVWLTYVENPGAFLGWGAELPDAAKVIVFICLAGVLLFGVLARIRHSKYRGLTEFGLVLFVAGGISNWMERAVHGRVVDFLHVDSALLAAVVFNVADVAIVLGLAAVFVGILRISLLPDTSGDSGTADLAGR